MRSVKTIFVALLFGLLAGCGGGSKPKDLIVGKWEPLDDQAKAMGVLLEFKADGGMIMKMKNPMKEGEVMTMVEAKYKFTDDTTVELELDKQGKKDVKKMKVEVTKDELTTTDADGKKPEKYKRMK